MVHKAAVVFENAYSGFKIINKLKNKGYKVMSFKPSNFILSKADNPDIVVLDMPTNHKKWNSLIEEMSSIKTTIIAITNKRNDNFFERFPQIKFVVNHINDIDGLLNQDVEIRFEFPVCSIKDMDKKIEDGKDLIAFIFDEFDNTVILNNERMLKDIYGDLKRRDEFFVVLNFGFVIVPSNQGDFLGIEALRKKIDEFVLKILENNERVEFLGSNIYKKGENFHAFVDILPKKNKKSISVNLKIGDVKDIRVDKNVLDKCEPSTMFLATKLLDKELVANLWLSEEYKKYVDAFIDVGTARIIAKLKDKISKDRLIRARDELFDKVSMILSSKRKISKESFYDSINEEDQLMSLPEVQRNIVMLINEDAPFSRIVKEIEKDPAITSKILKFANSVFYGLRKEVRSINKAAVILGTEELLGMSLSISYLSSSMSIYTKRLYRYSIATLAIAKYLESLASIATGVTLGSVVHVIGDMFYAQHFSDMFMDVIKGVRKGLSYEISQLKALPVSTEDLGEFLAKKWNFPKRAVNVIKYYLYPKQAGIDTTVHLVHAASILAKSFGYFFGDYSKDDLNYHTYSLFLKKFDMNLLNFFEKYDDIKDKVNEMMFILS